MNTHGIPDSLCIFGDSIGRGVIYNEEKDTYETDRGFISMLEGKCGIKVQNFTRFGQTIGKGLAMLERKADKVKGTKAVFLEFGGNDCDFDWKAIALDPQGFHAPKTTLSEFVSIYKKMIQTVRELGAEPIVLNLPPIEHNFYFDWVSDGVNADNILKWLDNDKKEIFRWHESYNYAVYNICRENRVKMIDIRSPFLSFDLKSLICRDGIHPNTEGHKIIFENILEFFK